MTTLGLYGHLCARSDERAAARLEDVFHGRHVVAVGEGEVVEIFSSTPNKAM